MTVWLGVIALGLGLGASLLMPVPQTLKTNFDAGQSLYALGEYEGAIIEYSKIVNFNHKAVRTDSVRVEFGDELELPVVAAAWYQLGNAYKKSGQHDKAVGAYHHVTEAKGVKEEFRSLVQFQVAETRFLQKEYDKAAIEYKRYVELFPKSDIAGKAFFYSGWSEFNLKRYDDSIETLQNMLQAYPEDRYASDAQFRIASAFYEKQGYERSISEAQTVLDKYPNSPMISQAVYLQANAYDEMGKSDEAIKAYRDVRALYDRMYELLRGSFREGKNVDFENFRQLFETSSLRVAEIYRKQNQFEEAYNELIAAQETAEERFYKAKVQMRIGDNYMAWEKYDDAWGAYNQVIELYADTPYPPNAQYQKGEAKYFGQKFADARTDYLQVLDDYPDSETNLRAYSLYSAGWTSEKLAESEEALKYYQRVVETFPRSDQAPLCLLRMARVNLEQQRIDEAIEAYTIVTENYTETKHVPDAYYGLGILYRDQGRTEDAVESFSKVSRDAGATYVGALIEAANIHIQAGRTDAGKNMLTQLLEGVTGDRALEATAHYQMAQLDLNNKNYGDALQGYTKVIDEYAESKEARDAHYGRGLAFHYMGRYNRALEDYQWLLDQKLGNTMKLKVQFSKALSHAASGDDQSATSLLNTVIDSGDETLARSARLQMISMAEKQDPDQAVRTYEDMLGRVKDDEDRVRILTRLASAYFRLGQYDRSIEASQRLIDMSADEESISSALFVQGNSHFKSGDFLKAVATYKSLIETYPEVGWAKNAQFQVGVSYYKLSSSELGALQPMSDAFVEFYTKYPEDEKTVTAYYYDSWAKYRLGAWRDASETFKTLATKFPKSKHAPEAMFRSGEAVYNLAQRGNRDEKNAIYEEAMGIYDQLVARYPRSEYGDDALYNKAWCLINLERKGEAVPVFERIVADFADGRYGPRSQFTLGDYFYGEKQYEKATENYQRFLEIYSEDKLNKMSSQNRITAQDRGLRQKAVFFLGQLAEIDAYNLYAEGEKFFDAKDYKEAMKIFEDVRVKYPKSDQAVNALVNIGAAYMAQEKWRDAGRIFKEVVDNYGDQSKYTQQVDFARQQLEVLEEARVL